VPPPMAAYYHVVSATAGVYDSPSASAKVWASLDRGDIIQAMQVVSVNPLAKPGVPAGTMAVQFAGGWVRTLGARGEMTVVPLDEVPRGAVKHLDGADAEAAATAAQEEPSVDVTARVDEGLPPQTPAQATPVLDAASAMVRAMLCNAMLCYAAQCCCHQQLSNPCLEYVVHVLISPVWLCVATCRHRNSCIV